MWGQGDSVFGDNSLVPFYLWWGETILKDEKVKYFVTGFRSDGAFPNRLTLQYVPPIL